MLKLIKLFIPDEILRNIEVKSKNPYGKNVYFQGYRYSGVYMMHDSDNSANSNERNPNTEVLGDDKDSAEIEILSR